jgi:hypothetical protein
LAAWWILLAAQELPPSLGLLYEDFTGSSPSLAGPNAAAARREQVQQARCEECRRIMVRTSETGL